MAYAAIYLNPTMKHRWFQEKWANGTAEQKAWLPQIDTQVKTLWLSDYKLSNTTTTSAFVSQRPVESNSRAAALSSTQVGIEDAFMERLAEFKRMKINSDVLDTHPLDEYLQTDNLDNTDHEKFDVLGYWYSQRHARPELARFAFDALAIPLMSDDNERSFSAGRDLITYRRNGLLSDIIEASQCLRQWLGKPERVRRPNDVPMSDFDDEVEIELDYAASKHTDMAEEEPIEVADEAL
ncbi:hypothetical protein LTR85_001794 [Meristemomyces frigidus]|nr:hypothetical protein LTR85_001794 [Meristemomyces frigidus]